MKENDIPDKSSKTPYVLRGFICSHFYVLLGIVLSLALLAGGCFFIGLEKLATFKQLPLNEMGDFIGGVATSLAFLWFILTVFMQRKELSMQREELKQNTQALKLQANEMHAAVEQASEQTSSMEKRYRLEQDKFNLDIWNHSHEKMSAMIYEFFNGKLLADFQDTSEWARCISGLESPKLYHKREVDVNQALKEIDHEGQYLEKLWDDYAKGNKNCFFTFFESGSDPSDETYALPSIKEIQKKSEYWNQYLTLHKKLEVMEKEKVSFLTPEMVNIAEYLRKILHEKRPQD